MPEQQKYFCAICCGPGSTKHHLVPKGLGTPNNNNVIRLCRKCHVLVYYFFSHWELAMFFNTEQTIKTELSIRFTGNITAQKSKILQH